LEGAHIRDFASISLAPSKGLAIHLLPFCIALSFEKISLRFRPLLAFGRSRSGASLGPRWARLLSADETLPNPAAGASLRGRRLASRGGVGATAPMISPQHTPDQVGPAKHFRKSLDHELRIFEKDRTAAKDF